MSLSQATCLCSNAKAFRDKKRDVVYSRREEVRKDSGKARGFRLENEGVSLCQKVPRLHLLVLHIEATRK
jgi:hypothetical protein